MNLILIYNSLNLIKVDTKENKFFFLIKIPSILTLILIRGNNIEYKVDLKVLNYNRLLIVT